MLRTDIERIRIEVIHVGSPTQRVGSMNVMICVKQGECSKVSLLYTCVHVTTCAVPASTPNTAKGPEIETQILLTVFRKLGSECTSRSLVHYSIQTD